MKLSLAFSALLAVAGTAHALGHSKLRGDEDQLHAKTPGSELDRKLTDSCVGLEDAITETDLVLSNKIYDIQGSGKVSPFFGQPVYLVRGVVTYVGDQIIIQDREGDSNRRTSDAIQVIFPPGETPHVAVGDTVVITEGTVVEGVAPMAVLSQPRSAIAADRNNVVVESRGNARPKATIIGSRGRLPPTEGLEKGQEFWESLKVMWVELRNAVTVSPTKDNLVYVTSDNGRYATGISERGTLNIDEDDFNPEAIAVVGADGRTPVVDVGTKFDTIAGHIWQTTIGTYVLFAEEYFGQSNDNVLEPTSSTCKFQSPLIMVTGTYNVDGSTDYTTLATHIVQNMGFPDVVALQGLTPGFNTTALVEQVRAVGNADSFAYTVIRNAQANAPADPVAILYNPWRVTQPTNELSFDGPPIHLAAKLRFLPLGENFDIINVALTDNTGSAAPMGVNQPFEDLQEVPTINAGVDRRIAETLAVRVLIEGDPTANPPVLPFVTDADKVVVLGSMYENEWVSPIQNLEGTPLKNLVKGIPNKERYSVIDPISGSSKPYDYIMVSEGLCAKSRAEYIHVNSEYSHGTFHDPMVACIKMPYDH